MSQPRPLRIACLHGYRQNAQRFRQKTGALRKALERDINHDRQAPKSPHSKQPLAELVYIDAPFVIEQLTTDMNPQGLTDDDKKHPPERAVFSPNLAVASKSGTGDAGKKPADVTQRTWWTAEGRKYSGWDQSLDFLRATFAEKKFEGILGFSQGGIVTSLICALRAEQRYTEFSSLQFAIMISGFPSRADAHQQLYEKPIEIPSLHVWGTQDQTVAPWMSQKLLEKFNANTCKQLQHKNGHLVPNDAASRSAIRDFVMEFGSADQNEDTDRPRASL